MTGLSAISVGDEPEHDHERRWAGVARIVGPVWAQLPSLTVGLFGVQMLWSVEMSYASPYLLSLGLPKSLMAIVFLAGPLSGFVVQPMIGMLADNSKSRFGRRRPIIMVCAALCAFATFLLGFTRLFATMFTALDSHSNDVLTIWLAIFSIYCIDFCINAVQALDRALLVDTLPTARQPAGNAWAASMLAVGSVAGFFFGNLDLPYMFPFLGSAQLEVLSVIAALLLFLTQAWVCLHVKERVLLRSSAPRGFRRELKELWATLVRLPSVIRQICWIQFFAWLGWFPVLFYTTVYIGDLHKKSSPIPENEDAAIALDAESTRLGTRAMFYSALVSLAANIVVPFFVVPQHTGHVSRPLQSKQGTWLERVRMHLASLWALSHFIFAICMAATFVTSTVSGATFILSVVGFCWAITQWAPFALLGEAILSHPASGDAGSIHLADTRSSHVVRPRDDVEYNADGEETQQLFQADVDDDDGDDDNEDASSSHSHTHTDVRVDVQSPSVSRTTSSDPGDECDPRTRVFGAGNSWARASRIDIAIPLSPPSADHLEENVITSTPGAGRKSANGLSTQAGAIIGIHNMFVVMPQFLVTGLSSIIFAIFDPDRSAPHGHHLGNLESGGNETITTASQDAARQLFTARSGDVSQTKPNSIAITFRLGGIAATIAFILSYRLAKELKRR